VLKRLASRLRHNCECRLCGLQPNLHIFMFIEINQRAALIARAQLQRPLHSLDVVEEPIHARNITAVHFYTLLNAKTHKALDELVDSSISKRCSLHGLRTPKSISF
jgi:hypothetical protein